MSSTSRCVDCWTCLTFVLYCYTLLYDVRTSMCLYTLVSCTEYISAASSLYCYAAVAAAAVLLCAAVFTIACGGDESLCHRSHPIFGEARKRHPPASIPTSKACASGAATGTAPAMTVTTLSAAVPGPDTEYLNNFFAVADTSTPSGIAFTDVLARMDQAGLLLASGLSRRPQATCSTDEQRRAGDACVQN